MRKFLAMLAASLLAIPLARAGGGEKGDWEFGPYVGFAALDDYGTLHPRDDAFVGGRVGYFFLSTWSVEASYQTLSTNSGIAIGTNQEPGIDLKSARLNILYHFRPGAVFRPFVTVGGGDESIEPQGLAKQSKLGYNAGGGASWLAGDHFSFRLDARWVSADAGDLSDSRQNNIEGLVGFSWLYGGAAPSDADGDGVPDKRDDCPGTPRGATVNKAGCPSDTDGDGVVDGVDQCPDTPKGYVVDVKGCSQDLDGDGVFDGPDKCPDTPKGATVDEKGCPADADADGVFDGLDQCPDTPKGAKVDAKGCPTDADGDGVYDGLDQCPDTPKGAKVDAKGCPLDGDGDGVYDGLDRCPDTEPGVKVGSDGCATLFEAGKATLVLRGVTFESNKAVITPDSEAILNQVAAALKERPDVRVEVAGFTDATGGAAHNQRLSEQRAEAVRAYLIGRGIDESRLTAKGYGESQPIADNGTEDGKAQNRRVELHRIE